MKKTTILLFAVFCATNLFASENLKEKILRKLVTNKVISYTINELIIQGSSTKTKFSSDTLFIKTYSSASFLKNDTDSTWGYNFVTADSLIHPYFKVPQKTIKVYKNGKMLSSLTSKMNNSYAEKKIQEIESEDLDLVVKGHITDFIYILKDKNTKQLNDTIINNTSSYHFNTPIKGKDNSLYISKKTLYPVLLRITTNTFQPFIEEFRYSNFKYSSKLNIPDLSKSKEKTKITTSSMKVNDILPNWELIDLQGNKFSFKKSEKYKIIYLSMINCGPCQQAIPYVEKMYNNYNMTENIEFIVFYPIDDKESLVKYVQRKKIKTQVVYNPITENDKRIEIINKLNIRYPSIFLVDKENRIKHIINGFSKDIEEIVKNEIDKLMDKE